MKANRPAYFDTLPLHPQPEKLESLTSYLTRLAEANRLRSVCDLFRLCFPVNRSALTFYTGDYPPLSFGALPTLAHCPEPRLQATTFHHLGKKFNRLLQPRPLAMFFSGSVGPTLRYCPRCLAERGYYSLTWRFADLAGCPDHGCRFLERCGHCGREVPLLASSPKLGICPDCEGDLRHCQAGELSESQWQMAQMRHRDLAFLLSPQPFETMGRQLPKVIGAGFTRWRQLRQLKRTDIARCLEQSLGVICYIEEGPAHRGIKFCWYVQYADFLQVRLRDIFECPLSPTISQTREEKLLGKVEQAIASLEACGEPVTQQAICQMIGVRKGIFSEYPDVGALWARAVARQKQEQEQALASWVQQAITQLQEQGRPVSQRAVTRLAELYRGQLRRSPQAWAVFEKASNYRPRASPILSIQETGHLKRARERERREAELLRQVQTAIRRLREEGKAVTRAAIAQMVGRSRTSLRDYPRVMAVIQANAVERSRQDEDELLERVRTALAYLEERGTLITQQAIGQLVGLTVGALRYYPRVRAFLAEEVTAKAHLHRARHFRQREEDLTRQVQQAMEVLTARERQVTQAAICEFVGMSSASLKRYPRVRLLLAQCGLTKPLA